MNTCSSGSTGALGTLHLPAATWQAVRLDICVCPDRVHAMCLSLCACRLHVTVTPLEGLLFHIHSAVRRMHAGERRWRMRWLWACTACMSSGEPCPCMYADHPVIHVLQPGTILACDGVVKQHVQQMPFRLLIFARLAITCRLVHLDLKSCNVLLGADGTAKISDVGMAAMMSNAYLTKQLPVCTLAWGAPEVITGGGRPPCLACTNCLKKGAAHTKCLGAIFLTLRCSSFYMPQAVAKVMWVRCRQGASRSGQTCIHSASCCGRSSRWSARSGLEAICACQGAQIQVQATAPRLHRHLHAGSPQPLSNELCMQSLVAACNGVVWRGRARGIRLL